MPASLGALIALAVLAIAVVIVVLAALDVVAVGTYLILAFCLVGALAVARLIP